ncbi:MAG: nucleotidyltransferase domain-containing protein [bacterium]
MIEIDKKRLAEICKRWNITEVSLFGSALTKDFDEINDVDLMVSFTPECKYSLFDIVHIQDDFASLFAKPVDLAMRSAVENSANYIRRKAIINSARVIYEA